MMISKVKVIGLQRSGTNYLEELIRRNFEVFVYDHPLYPFYKHAGPYDKTVNLNSGEKIYTESPKRCLPFFNVLYIVIEKNVNKWIRSIQRNPVDMERKHPEIYKNGILDIKKARELHEDYYKSWKELEHQNLVFVKYENLIRDFGDFMQVLKINYFLDKRRELRTYVDVDKVPQSRRFTEKQKKFYLS